MTHIRFGYMFDMRNPRAWHRPDADLYAETLEFITWLESIGFESVWFPEHHGTEDGYIPSPLTVAAAVAARTERMRISPGIAIAPFYHPVRLAEDMAVLDILSRGRAELALGVGYLPRENRAYGSDFRGRGRQTDELLQIVKPLWRGETVDFRGEFFQLEGARISPLPVQEGGIPLLIGGLARPGFRRAARYGDGYIGGVDQYPTYLEEVRAAGGDARAPRLDSVSDLWFLVSEDPEKTLDEVAPHYYHQIKAYADWQEDVGWGIPQLDLETVKQSGMIQVLTPEQAIEWIRGRAAAAEGLASMGMMVPAGYPLSKLAEHAELFATKVIPAFR